jgi:integrase
MKGHDLAKQLDSYLALKAALGYSLQAEAILWDFVRFVEAGNDKGAITAQIALDWACSTGCGPAGQSRRLGFVRGFLSYVRASLPGTEVPGSAILASARRPNPYIYSPAEIERFLEDAQSLGPRGSLQPHTYTTLIGLLVSSGLRLGEALRLGRADARLQQDPPHLLITQSKFRKSRVVPVHPTTAERLTAYLKQRGDFGDPTAFFVSLRGRPLYRLAVWRVFQTLCRRAGIRKTADGRRPTVHGFRHYLPFLIISSRLQK